MATMPENMRKGVTYYIATAPKSGGRGKLIRGEFRGRDENGRAIVMMPSGKKTLIPAGTIVSANAVRS